MELDRNSEGTRRSIINVHTQKNAKERDRKAGLLRQKTSMNSPNDACCIGFVKATRKFVRRTTVELRNPLRLGLGLSRKSILSLIQKSAVFKRLINTLSSSERFVIRLSVDSSYRKKKRERK